MSISTNIIIRLTVAVLSTLMIAGCNTATETATATATPTTFYEVKRSIINVAGDVYRFQNAFHYSLVTVTEDGVVVVDPINTEASEWLMDNLSSITDKPITHLIYSHSHDDHAIGGQVYADAGAEVIAQANAPESIYGVQPDRRFDDTMVMEVGGKTFELTYLGKGHGDDLIAVTVRPENVVFVTDAVSTKTIPYLSGSVTQLDGWINQVKTIESLGFDILAPSHGTIGTKADATDVRVYIETLREQVLAGLLGGKSVDDLAVSVKMEKFKEMGQYAAWHEGNVRSMALFLDQSGQVN